MAAERMFLVSCGCFFFSLLKEQRCKKGGAKRKRVSAGRESGGLVLRKLESVLELSVGKENTKHRRTGGYYCPFDFFLTRDSTSLTRPQLGKNGTNPILTVESPNALASLAGHV